MTTESRGPFSAANPALGYLYQIRLALLESLQRLRRGQDFLCSIETLDDVVFESPAPGSAVELLQTKHHQDHAADLTDASPDIWKSLRIWCDGIRGNDLPAGALFFLITTATAATGHAASYLMSGFGRDPRKAMERLDATAQTSSSQANSTAYASYLKLNADQRLRMLESTYVLDQSPNIESINDLLREAAFGFAPSGHLDSFLARLEGWWFQQSVRHLLDPEATPILSEEIDAETSRLREQFKADNLPIDQDIMQASIDASGYDDRIFVEQLRLIEIGNGRIFHAIRNLYRAAEHRSRWMREDLLYVGDLSRYEDLLAEEWDLLFCRMQDKLGDEAGDAEMVRAAQTLYEWVETGAHIHIRPGVIEASIPRGTYHILADEQKVGWHPHFRERIAQILAERGATS